MGVLTDGRLPLLSHRNLNLAAFHSCEFRGVSSWCLPAERPSRLAAVRREIPLSHAQTEQIRSSLGHLRRLSVGWMNSDRLTLYLQPPVTPRWQDIGIVLTRALDHCSSGDPRSRRSISAPSGLRHT